MLCARPSTHVLSCSRCPLLHSTGTPASRCAASRVLDGKSGGNATAVRRSCRSELLHMEDRENGVNYSLGGIQPRPSTAGASGGRLQPSSQWPLPFSTTVELCVGSNLRELCPNPFFLQIGSSPEMSEAGCGLKGTLSSD